MTGLHAEPEVSGSEAKRRHERSTGNGMVTGREEKSRAKRFIATKPIDQCGSKDGLVGELGVASKLTV